MSRFRTGMLLAAAAFAGLTLSAGTASAKGTKGCHLAFESGAEQWLLRYDPLTQDVVERQFDIPIVNHGDERCNGAVKVELRGEQFGLSQPGDPLRVSYLVIDDRGGGDVTPRGGQSPAQPARPLFLEPGERGLLRFTFAAAPASMLASGLHTQNVTIILETPNGLPLAETMVILALEVPPAALMGLKGEFARQGGVATIDLGELTEGRRPLATSLYVVSTGGYVVTVTSANAGRLRQGTTEWFVPYQLALGDRRIELAAPDRLEVVSTRPRIDDYPLTISIGSVAGKRAGDYADTLTFVISAI